MATIEYNLFRVKFIRPRQTSFLHKDLSPRDVLLVAIDERPSMELVEGYTWHIGNVQHFSDYTGYFAVGRTTKSTIEMFDEESGDFVEELIESSPYTHCVFNAEIGFLGIAQKRNLARTANGIAGKVERLFARTDVVVENDLSVEIPPIPDPSGFLLAILESNQVLRFTATFKGPNPFDADAYFQKPLSVYCREANAIKGKATIDGEDLNREVLEAVTRSTAATGNEASATVVRKKLDRPQTIHLKGDAIKRNYDESEHDPEQVVEDLNAVYDRVRSNE